VRELENVIERAVALAQGPIIGLGDLPPEVAGAVAQPLPALVALSDDGCKLDEVLGEVERRLILQALERSGGVRSQASKLLNVTLRSLRYRLHKHGLGDAESDVVDVEPTSGPDVEGLERDSH
jgi:two-component system response regulator PilR (NtrC family)